jgi:hypothetical protein
MSLPVIVPYQVLHRGSRSLRSDPLTLFDLQTFFIVDIVFPRSIVIFISISIFFVSRLDLPVAINVIMMTVHPFQSRAFFFLFLIASFTLRSSSLRRCFSTFVRSSVPIHASILDIRLLIARSWRCYAFLAFDVAVRRTVDRHRGSCFTRASRMLYVSITGTGCARGWHSYS